MGATEGVLTGEPQVRWAWLQMLCKPAPAALSSPGSMDTKWLYSYFQSAWKYKEVIPNALGEQKLRQAKYDPNITRTFVLTESRELKHPVCIFNIEVLH